jgi:hypothetical protein
MHLTHLKLPLCPLELPDMSEFHNMLNTCSCPLEPPRPVGLTFKLVLSGVSPTLGLTIIWSGLSQTHCNCRHTVPDMLVSPSQVTSSGRDHHSHIFPTFTLSQMHWTHPHAVWNCFPMCWTCPHAISVLSNSLNFSIPYLQIMNCA